MKFTRFNRIFAALMSVLLLCASVPAQYQLGTRRMEIRRTPTLTNRSRLSTVLGPRPRIGYVGRIGGIASDGVAAPEQGLIVNSIVPTYSASRPDGQRLSVTINGETVTAPVYDWQLIPIAKFANSKSFSCFTLFGDRSESTSAYHSDFTDTLVGLRLFQLDSLIEDSNSTDLVKDQNGYILGAGESAPNKEENDKGLEAYEKFYEANIDLFHYRSYIISDYQRNITFRVEGNSLRLKGDPSFYFWKLDPDSLYQFTWGIAEETVSKSLGSASRYTKTSLINQTLREVNKYEVLTEKNGYLDYLLSEEFEELWDTSDQQRRAALLRAKSHAELFDLLVEIRAFNSLEWTIEMPELSRKVSNETAMLRAINPAVWDTGVNLIQYAAFFRYCKSRQPQRWQAFMRQINAAPPPKPPVTTPSGFEF